MDIMKKIAGIGAAALAVTGAAFLAKKAVKKKHESPFEKFGREIDASILKATNRIEVLANKVRHYAGNGKGEEIGREMEEAISEAKSDLDHISSEMKQKVMSLQEL
ncbi:MAG: hypothetical protein GF401_09440 [Chitinivibrionales bacterium]|nr:hypothetical protein [Chitinivibrionales bacterium]